MKRRTWISCSLNSTSTRRGLLRPPGTASWLRISRSMVMFSLEQSAGLSGDYDRKKSRRNSRAQQHGVIRGDVLNAAFVKPESEFIASDSLLWRNPTAIILERSLKSAYAGHGQAHRRRIFRLPQRGSFHIAEYRVEIDLQNDFLLRSRIQQCAGKCFGCTRRVHRIELTIGDVDIETHVSSGRISNHGNRLEIDASRVYAKRCTRCRG